MKKLLYCFMISAVLVCAMGQPAFAYDYRSESIENDQNAQAMYSMEEAVLGSLADDAERWIDFASAVEVHHYEWLDFIAMLGSDDPAAAMENHVWKNWIVPIRGGSGCEYVVLGAESYSTVQNANQKEELTFLYSPEVVDAALESKNFDNVYVVEIPQWHVYFVVLLHEGTLELMPFASRPDFLLVENGMWYTRDDMIAVLSAYAETTQPGSTLTAGGGAAGKSSHAVFWMIGAAVVLCLLFCLLLAKLRRH